MTMSISGGRPWPEPWLFPSRYGLDCARCGARIASGQLTGFPPGTDKLCCETCCREDEL